MTLMVLQISNVCRANNHCSLRLRMRMDGREKECHARTSKHHGKFTGKTIKKAYLENTFRRKKRQLVKRCANNTRKNIEHSINRWRDGEDEKGENIKRKI